MKKKIRRMKFCAKSLILLLALWIGSLFCRNVDNVLGLCHASCLIWTFTYIYPLRSLLLL